MYHDMLQGNVFITQDEGKSWDRAVGIPPGDAAMAIEHPFDSRYVRIVHILLWSTALIHFTRHLYLPRERPIIALRTAEGRGAHSQYQHHLLTPRRHSRSTRILQSGGISSIKVHTVLHMAGRNFATTSYVPTNPVFFCI